MAQSPPMHRLATYAIAALALALAACATPHRGAGGTRAAATARPAPASPPSASAATASGSGGPSGATASGSGGPPGALARTEPATEEEGEAQLPPGFVALSSTGGDGPVACGRFRVENVRDDPRRFEPRVVVRDEAGRKAYEARGRRWRPGGAAEPAINMALWVDWCGDLTGDGVPEIGMTESTLGAHCCYTHYVVSLTSPPKRLLMWEKGDGGFGLRPERMKPGPALQLVSTDLVWPPFNPDAGDPAVSYSGVPGFPIIFDLVGDAYVPRTFLFQDALRRRRQENEEACARRPDRCEGFELIDWGWALILGDWDSRKATLIDDDELRQALDRRAAAMKATLRRQLGP